MGYSRTLDWEECRKNNINARRGAYISQRRVPHLYFGGVNCGLVYTGVYSEEIYERNKNGCYAKGESP
jgi:hypothetical protein